MLVLTLTSRELDFLLADRLLMLCNVQHIDKYNRSHIEKRIMRFHDLAKGVFIEIIIIPESRHGLLIGVAKHRRIYCRRIARQVYRCGTESDNKT